MQFVHLVFLFIYQSLNFLIKNNNKQEQEYSKNIVYKEVFNNLPKITIGMLQNNNFYLGVIILYLIIIIPIQFIHFVIIIIYFVIVYQIEYIFYKFKIKLCNARL